MEGVIVYYHCEICGDRFDTEAKAAECFSYGRLEQVIPTGTILGLHSEKMVFVVAKFNPHGKNSHNASYLLWGFRDTSAGDSELEGENGFCGDEFTAVHHVLSGKKNRYYSPGELRRQATYYSANTKIPAFQRAVAFCKRKGIGGKYWDGKRLADLLK